MADKKTRKALTVEFKRNVLKCVELNPKKKKIDIAKEFGITPTTLATIIKNKEKFKDEGGLPKHCKKAKKGELKDVEEAVLKWFTQCRAKNVPITGPLLQEKAQQFAAQLGHADFRASNGWLYRFQNRHDINCKKVCGESAAVDDTLCDDWKEKLTDLTREYHPDDVYNADESGLFYKCLPDKTLTFRGDTCNGGKNSKERLTVLLCTNSTGTHKLKPLIIGKSSKPRCFKNVSTLPTDYKANRKAWMTRDMFHEWLVEINKEMKNKKKNILLFVDNCTAHGDVQNLSNIKVQFLPPNTTSKLQPLDQGIIKNFKTYYRREVVRQFLNDIESQTPTKINILDAMWMVTKAWTNVTNTTIANCFKKSGFKVNEPDRIQDEDDPVVPTQPNIEVEWPRVQDALYVDMAFEEFVTFDDELAVCGELSEAEILSSVTGEPIEDDDPDKDDEEDAANDQPDYTAKDAKEAIDVLKCYFLKKNGLSESVVKSLMEMDCALDTIKINSSKQASILDFFKST